MLSIRMDTLQRHAKQRMCQQQRSSDRQKSVAIRRHAPVIIGLRQAGAVRLTASSWP